MAADSSPVARPTCTSRHAYSKKTLVTTLWLSTVNQYCTAAWSRYGRGCRGTAQLMMRAHPPGQPRAPTSSGLVVLARVPGMISNTQHSAPLLRRSCGRPALEGLALTRGVGAGEQVARRVPRVSRRNAPHGASRHAHACGQSTCVRLSRRSPGGNARPCEQQRRDRPRRAAGHAGS